MNPEPTHDKLRFRTVFISDTHLGTRGCKAEFLHDFLKSIDTDYLYLVGDIIDLWKARSGWYWNETQNKILRRILKIANKGTRVYFVPGNHDEYFRDFAGISFGEVDIVDQMEHEMADGRRFLVLHGDRFDAIVCNHKWLAILGGKLYDWIVAINSWFNWARKKLGMRYWSLAQYLKLKAKRATKVIGNFERIVSDYARAHGYDGVVCGHIHKAEMRDMNGVLYCNDGDWVESCTALVEHLDGRLEIIEWTDTPVAVVMPPTPERTVDDRLPESAAAPAL
ncbi:MAG: UDP-2,3-diacylglucosamine diphosphatase [Planctomycetes bacterium]|nr:UDP-2,3-diacylglucosamine diphosphatase [Planctomycetota bacterium]